MSFRFDNYARKTGSQEGNLEYVQWKVFMDESVETLARVKSVEYKLHHTFPDPIVLVKDRVSKFALSGEAWGGFTIFITVFLNDGTQENTNYNLDLMKSWPIEDLGNELLRRNSRNAAIKIFEEGLDIACKSGDLHSKGIMLLGLGRAYGAQDRWEKALDKTNEAYTIFADLGERDNQAKVLLTQGITYEKQGRQIKSIEKLVASLDIFRELNDEYNKGIALMHLGDIYKNKDNLDDAVENLSDALLSFRIVGSRDLEGRTLEKLADIEALRSRPNEAIKYYEMSLNIKHEMKDRYGEFDVKKKLNECYSSLL